MKCNIMPISETATTMNSNTVFIKKAMLMPILLPLMLWLVSSLIDIKSFSDSFYVIEIIVTVIAASLPLGGVAYCLFLVKTWKKIATKNNRQMYFYLFSAPVYVAVIEFFIIFLVVLFNSNLSSDSFTVSKLLIPSGILALYTLLVGYFYIFFIALIFKLKQNRLSNF